MKMIEKKNNDYYNIKTGKKLEKFFVLSSDSTKEKLEKTTKIVEVMEDILKGDVKVYSDGEIRFFEGDDKKTKKFTNRQSLLLSVWGGLYNGNASCPETMGFGFITEDTWYVAQGSLAIYICNELKLKDKENFKSIEKSLNSLGWHHSDWNRFVNIIETVGWTKGFKWINHMIEWLKLNAGGRLEIIDGERFVVDYDKNFYITTTENGFSYGERTHGDDIIDKTGDDCIYKCGYFTSSFNVKTGKIYCTRNIV